VAPKLLANRVLVPGVRQQTPAGKLSVLVVSGRWTKLHSTHRVTRMFVDKMKTAFEVSLLFAQSERFTPGNADVGGFKEVRFVKDDQSTEFLLRELTWIQSQRFDVIFFPEVRKRSEDVVCLSLASESVIAWMIWITLQFGAGTIDSEIAAARLATVQIASYGMSGSSHSPFLDYFIGGAEVESVTCRGVEPMWVVLVSTPFLVKRDTGGRGRSAAILL
jgi:hypothetical protein